MDFPIKLYRNEVSTTELTNETFHIIQSGDVLVAKDSEGAKVSVSDAFKQEWVTETKAQYGKKDGEAAKPVAGINPYKEDHLRDLFPTHDDRDWKTESSAQYIKKDGKMAKVRLNEERRQLVTLAP